MQKKFTRLLSMCLALVMVLSLTPLQVFAESSELPDDSAIILSPSENSEGAENTESLSIPDGQQSFFR